MDYSDYRVVCLIRLELPSTTRYRVFADSISFGLFSGSSLADSSGIFLSFLLLNLWGQSLTSRRCGSLAPLLSEINSRPACHKNSPRVDEEGHFWYIAGSRSALKINKMLMTLYAFLIPPKIRKESLNSIWNCTGSAPGEMDSVCMPPHRLLKISILLSFKELVQTEATTSNLLSFPIFPSCSEGRRSENQATHGETLMGHFPGLLVVRQQ